MFFVSVLRHALFLLIPLSFFSTFYLYLYPAFHFCAFPSPEHDVSPNSAYINTLSSHILPSLHTPTKLAPFRLLALGDPQLEGSSSIPHKESVTFPHFRQFLKDAFLLDGTRHKPLERIRHSLHDLVDLYFDDLPKALEVYRKRIDHIGNDYYLGHIYRTLHWWTNPTHVTVLGDLVGSQWIDDAEFEERGGRFWNRVFRGGKRVDDGLAEGNIHALGEEVDEWKKRIINIAGNHDIGYAGDLSPERMVRFERVFGKANYELRFSLPLPSSSSFNSSFYPGSDASSTPTEKEIPELRIIILNDMNLDTPASSSLLQDTTYSFLNSAITSSHPVTQSGLFTILLTHIPLYKPEGVCVDGPLFTFFEHGQYNNGIREQNHLSESASKGILEGLFGMSGNPDVDGQGIGRNGIILTGHDHEGCDVYHYINQSIPGPMKPEWEVSPFHSLSQKQEIVAGKEKGIPRLREITLRSMMGDFDGNAGLLSLWFDEEKWEWEMGFENCGMGSQHGWWIVHVLDLITLGVGIVYGVLHFGLRGGKKGMGQKGMEKGANGGVGNGVMRNRNINELMRRKSKKLPNGHWGDGRPHPANGNAGGEK